MQRSSTEKEKIVNVNLTQRTCKIMPCGRGKPNEANAPVLSWKLLTCRRKGGRQGGCMVGDTNLRKDGGSEILGLKTWMKSATRTQERSNSGGHR